MFDAEFYASIILQIILGTLGSAITLKNLILHKFVVWDSVVASYLAWERSDHLLLPQDYCEGLEAAGLVGADPVEARVVLAGEQFTCV